MPEYEAPSAEQQTDSQDPSRPPDPKRLVVRMLAHWLHKRGGPFSAPCPTRPDDCAAWWMAHMQETEYPQETRLAGIANGGMRWEEGYALRCATSLLRFLDMSDVERKLVIGGVQDGVPYRGDSPDFYSQVYNETMRMRSMDKTRYIRECLQGMKALHFGMTTEQREMAA